MNESGNGGLQGSGNVDVFFSSHLCVIITGVRHVSGIEIYTAKEVEVVNGTNVKLKCTFTTTQPVSTKTVTVSWNFRSINSATDESVCRKIFFIKML